MKKLGKLFLAGSMAITSLDCSALELKALLDEKPAGLLLVGVLGTVVSNYVLMPEQKCTHCNMSFGKDRTALNLHKKDVHGIEINEIQCEGCKKIFATENPLRNHRYGCQKYQNYTRERFTNR